MYVVSMVACTGRGDLTTVYFRKLIPRSHAQSNEGKDPLLPNCCAGGPVYVVVDLWVGGFVQSYLL